MIFFIALKGTHSLFFVFKKKRCLSLKVVVFDQILHRFIEPYKGYNKKFGHSLNSFLFSKQGSVDMILHLEIFSFGGISVDSGDWGVMIRGVMELIFHGIKAIKKITEV